MIKRSAVFLAGLYKSVQPRLFLSCTICDYNTPLWKSAPVGIRTPVLALKGPRPSPLDDGGGKAAGFYHSLPCRSSKSLTFLFIAEQGEQINLSSIEQDSRTFDAQLRDHNRR